MPIPALTESSACAAVREETDIFDPAEAMDRACDDLDLMTELAEMFRENQHKLLASLNEGVAAGCAQQVKEAAHSLKGSIGTFSTRRPFRLAGELETCGKQNRLEAAPELLDSLTAALHELNQAVTTFLASHR